MRTRSRWRNVVLLVTLGCPGTVFAEPAATATALPDLRSALESAPDEAVLRARLRALAPALRARLSEQEGRDGHAAFDLDLSSPFPARAVVRALGLERAYAVAGDAHQEDWAVELWAGDLESRWSSGIAVHTPHVGVWSVETKLAGRPDGPLPKIVAGASPAYDLEAVDAPVVAFHVERWLAEWQQPEHLASPEGTTPPAVASSRAALRTWVERHKGFGAPHFAEDSSDTAHVFVAWNVPWSGRNTTDYWIYCLQESGWTRLTSATFAPRTLADHAVFDRSGDAVAFVEADGRVAQRASIAGCRWPR